MLFMLYNIPRKFRSISKSLALCMFSIVLSSLSLVSNAQVTVTGGYTAAQMAAKLAGPGVIVTGAVLNCDATAYGQFNAVGSSLGIDSGIVLTTGTAVTTGITTGVNIIDGTTASLNFASTLHANPGDADLTVLSGGIETNDACILEFDFHPAGDTISFNYIFGSEEYTSFTCTNFNDVFGFLITGGAYTTPTNLALVPGTSIPVCINSVNCGPTGSGVLSNCTALGAGSPFCAYFVDNSAGTDITYDGITTLLTARAIVDPCLTYHLKLGIADASDDALDSGVFLEAGSLTSTPPVDVSSIGLEGSPYIIRGCAPGRFIFTRAAPLPTPTNIAFNVSGTAINGVDYASIPLTSSIPAGETSDTLDISALLVPATGPKTVIIEILTEDPCNPGVFIPGDTAVLTIIDSFTTRILNPDTTICLGQTVNVRATSDPYIASALTYSWSPAATVSVPNILMPTLTPITSTVYTLSVAPPAVYGCPAKQLTLRVNVVDPFVSVATPSFNNCVDNTVTFSASAGPTGYTYSYIWSPTTYLDNPASSIPNMTPTAFGDFIYTVTASVNGVAGCFARNTVSVHVPEPMHLFNNDTVICIGQSVGINATGSNEYTYLWQPPTGVSNVNILTPTITPLSYGLHTYVVSANYAACAEVRDSITIKVDTPAAPRIIVDTICLGMSTNFDFTVPGSDAGLNYYGYQWHLAPGNIINNDTIPNPIITPTALGWNYDTVYITPQAQACRISNYLNVLVLPNAITVTPVDTSICAGATVPVFATGHPLFTYQWIPTTGIPLSTNKDVLITTDTSATYTLTASFPGCPDMTASMHLDVQPNPSAYIGNNRMLCQFDTAKLTATVSPSWYTSYSYNWTPSTDLDHSNTPTVVFSGSDTAKLIVEVSTPAGCKAKDSIVVNVIPGNFMLALADQSFCPGDSRVITPTSTASTPVSYHWYPWYYLSDSLSSSPVLSPIANQTYTVIATDAYGCKDTASFDVTVHPAALITIADSSTLYPGETYTIETSTNCTSFDWFPRTGLTAYNVSNPTASPDISTQYIVTGTTEYGCEAKDTIMINVDPQSILALPNAFAPGNGTNNEFKILTRGVVNLKYYRIFNRWGNLVFETSNISKGWDGTLNGQPCPFGVYVYQIEGETSLGTPFVKKGNVTLLR